MNDANGSQSPDHKTAKPAPSGIRPLRVLLGSAMLSAACLGYFLGLPHIQYALRHTSTDDAQVNGHVTFVGARVASVVETVLVEENQFVAAGAPLVHLDDTGYKLAVAMRQSAVARAHLAVDEQVAALKVAEAELNLARTHARSQISGLAAAWYLVATVQDFVRYGSAAVRSTVATLQQKQASFRLSQVESARYNQLGTRGVTQEVIDQHRVAMQVAEQEVQSASENVQQSRALLGLGPDTGHPGDIPGTVAETFNGTQYAVATCVQALTQLGLKLELKSIPLEQLRQRLLSLSVDKVVENSPSVVAAAARVEKARAALGNAAIGSSDQHPSIVQAQKELELAELELSYTVVRAPLAGFISQRSVNPGAHVSAGQALLAIRPLAEVWIEANFKETQLSDLRIGQSVEIFVDAYPDRVFHGRVAGFSPGTGAVSSLLPPENATGNFVKVVQRLPVRIELTSPPPTDTPLFAGLSVEPEVDIATPPTGPDAGARLVGYPAKYLNSAGAESR